AWAISCRSLIFSEGRQTAWGRADRFIGSRYASAAIRRRNLARIATNADAAAGGASMHASNERGGRGLRNHGSGWTGLPSGNGPFRSCWGGWFWRSWVGAAPFV